MAEIASAFVSLVPSARGFGSKLESEIGPGVRTTGTRLGTSFGKLFAVAGGALIGAKVVGFFKDSVSEAREAQKVGALTEQVIKSTGGAANVTTAQVGKLATAISLKTGIDDEQIQSGENLLLTFKNVANQAGKNNDIFNQATQATTDMAAAMAAASGGQIDLKSSTTLVGKALNDPIKGLSALSRVGVTFTAGQQKQIKALVESGHAMAAQKIILKELNSEFGGAAAAQATAGEKAKVAFKNLEEQIGTALLPVIDKVATVLTTSVIPAISGFVAGMQSGTGAGGTFATIFKTLFSVLSVVVGVVMHNKAVFGAFLAVLVGFQIIRQITLAVMAFNLALSLNPIGVVVLALAALAAGLVYAYQHFETFRKITDAVFGFLKTAVSATIGFVKAHWQLIVSIIGGPLVAIGILVVKHWGAIKAATSATFNAIKSVVSAVMGFVGNYVRTQIAIARAAFNGIADLVGKVRAWFGAILSAIKDKLGEAVAFTKTIPSKMLSAFTGMGQRFYDAGAKLVSMLAQGIRDMAQDAIDALKGLAGKLAGMVPGSPVKEGPLKSFNGGHAGQMLMEMLANGIHSASPKVLKAMQAVVEGALARMDKLHDGVSSRLDSVKSAFSSLKDSIASTFAGNLFDVSAILPDATTIGHSISEVFRNGLQQTQANLTNLLDAFKTLKGWGVPAAFLSQLFASGNSALILEMAHGSQGDALSAASLFGNVQSLSQQLGGNVAKNQYGAQISRLDKKLERIEAHTSELKHMAKDIAKELNAAAAHAQKKAGKSS